MTTMTRPKANWVRVTKRNPCRVCGKPDWCLVSEDGKAVICARIESDRPAGKKGAGWIHRIDTMKPLPPPKPRPDAKQIPKAAPDVLDTAYRALLAELPLSEIHRENLQSRGLTSTQIASLGYRTLPANGRPELVSRLQAKGVKLTGVPGFYLEAGQWQLAGPVGIAIPVRDTRGRLIGLQLRCDNAEGGRYKWLSSRGFNAGCSPGAPVHVVGPVSTNSEIWITEGPIKADIVTLKLGRTVLAVPGVGNWRGIIPIVRELKPSRVIVAYDLDRYTNQSVRHYEVELIRTLLTSLRIKVFEARWNPEHKGIDDLITSGGRA